MEVEVANVNQKTWTICVLAGVAALWAFTAAKTEYARIQARIETTQAKVDALADETREAIATVHKAIRSITDRFTKQLEDASQSNPVIIEHPKQEPVVFEPPKRQPTIVMHSGYSCGPCNAWIATEQSKWEMVGWLVEVRKEVSSKRGWPWYEITDRNGKRFEVDGPLMNDLFYAAQKAK